MLYIFIYVYFCTNTEYLALYCPHYWYIDIDIYNNSKYFSAYHKPWMLSIFFFSCQIQNTHTRPSCTSTHNHNTKDFPTKGKQIVRAPLPFLKILNSKKKKKRAQVEIIISYTDAMFQNTLVRKRSHVRECTVLWNSVTIFLRQRRRKTLISI